MTEERPGPLLAGPAPLPPASRRKRSRARRLAYAILAPLLYGFARLLWLSLRVRTHGGEELDAHLEAEKPVVLAFWHDQLFPCVLHLRRRFELHDRRIVFLVSPSVDGDLVTRVIELGGGLVVRGSATRSGVKSLRDLYRALKREGASPIVVPDGPRGPVHACKPGAVLLAQLAGVPVVPLACRIRPALRLPTWDRLQVPLPFARVELSIGAPFMTGGPAGGEVLDGECAELEERMLELSRRHS